MAEWNDNSPKGAPMVKVKGFPGPLYPPSNAKGPSAKSDFVLALKRTAARIGAWPWQPDSWDQAYSERFAMGDGYESETHGGIKALQQWSGTIDPTGNLGEKTFNFLRSVKVPQGRTHAGEMAMDSVAINQINAAYEQAHVPPPPSKTVRQRALERAIAEIGNKENPPESNLTKYGDWYGENGVPWCAIFATWAYENASRDLGRGDHPSFASLSATGGTADRWDYVPYIVSDARNGRYGLSVTNSPLPGDMVCFDWNRNGEYDHVGLFEAWKTGSDFTSVEGNTSTSDNSNGGQVMRRTRSTGGQGTVFVRVAEP